jgi:thioredoxin reductase
LVEQVERESAIRVLYRAPVRSLGAGMQGSIEVASADARLSTDAVLLAIGRRRTVPELITKICTRLTASEGLWIVGDARAGRLGQVGVAVGDGLAAAARACQFVRAEQQEEAYDSHHSTQ